MLARPTATTHFLTGAGRKPDAHWRAVWEAAFALVVSRFTGRDEVVFGAARYDGGPGQIRTQVRSIVRRVRCDDDVTAAALLRRLEEEEAEPGLDAGTSDPAGGEAMQSPLVVDKFLSIPPGPGHAIAAPTVRPCAGSAQPVSLHVTVALAGASAPRLLAVHDAQFLSSDTCAHMLAALEHVAAEILRDPGRPLGQIHVLGPSDERRILFDWNETARAFDDEIGIHTGFERQAGLRPFAVAVEADGASVTYAELDQRANQIAHALTARGAGPGSQVGVCLERGTNLVAALLGVAKSGAAYVPFDPVYPAERITRMREIAATDLIITEPQLRHLFGGARIVEMDARGLRENEALPTTRIPWEKERARERASDPCYAIFTSGSTGDPKGVVMTHRAVVNTLDWVTRSFGVRPGDRVLLVSSSSFDLSVFDVFGVLGAGGTVAVASPAVLDDPEALARDLVDKRITIWNSAPAALQRIMPFLPATPPTTPAAPRALRLVLLSGDWIPLHLPGEVRAAFPGAEVVALGGATEAAIWSNAFRIPPEGLDPAWKSVPYGRPIQNARYHVLDRRMHPVPVGTSGDLYIGGTCLANGYLNRPELTAERFVADPFREGERLYRTGDLARYFPDGTIEFLGRADSQVKIRGFRVELAEIEAALLRQPGLRAAVCMAADDPSGQKTLVAYVVPEGEGFLEGAALRRALGACLPAYMVPSQIVVCRSLPLTSNGKIDRRPAALRAHAARTKVTLSPGASDRDPVDAAAAAGRARDQEPRGLYEAALGELWRELLGVPRVGRHDNFYDLGGHSLLAVKMVVALRERLRAEVPLSALVGYPTIAKLAPFVASCVPAPEPDDTLLSVEASEEEDTIIEVAPTVDPAPGEVPVRRGTPHLFALNASGTKPPLVLVAGLGGHAFTFGIFPRLLGDDQPIYAFHAVGTDSSEAPRPRTIEEIAEIYEAELDRVLPRGPVVLGGFSFGALPAFELARRLVRRGQEVPLFVSLDGFAPGYPRRLPLPARLWAHGRELLTGGPAGRRAYLSKTQRNLRARLLNARGRQLDLVPDLHADGALNIHAKQHWLENKRAMRLYRPRTGIASALLLLRVEHPERWLATKMDDPLYGWGDHVGGPATLATLPGSHLALMRSPANQKAAADVIAKHIEALGGGRVAAAASR